MTEENNEEFSREYLSKAVKYIKSKVPFIPKILIVCGSGLSALGDTLEGPICLKYQEIPNFPQITVEGHVGELIFGTLSNNKVMCMKGRFHYYEGNSLKKTTMPVRIAKLLGVELLIVTNAAGGTNKDYKVGDIMVIKDHINFLGFAGQNPLRGPNDDRFGVRFFPINKAYDRDLIQNARQIAKEMNLGSSYHEGVYAMLGGPNYESIAEILALRVLGVDSVGMSTVPEVLVATHCGLKVFGFSLITNVAITDYESNEEPNHQEVQRAVSEKATQLKEFVTKFIGTCNFPCKCKTKK